MAPLRLSVLGIALLLAACQGPVLTGEPLPPLPSAGEGGEPIRAYPQLLGRWTAVMRLIYTGEGPHTLGVANEDPMLAFERLDVTFDVQQDQVFYGTIRSAVQEEDFAGAIRSGGGEAIYITRSGRGRMWFDPESPDSIEVCGGRGSEATLLSFCGRLERVPPPDYGLPVPTD